MGQVALPALECCLLVVQLSQNPLALVSPSAEGVSVSQCPAALDLPLGGVFWHVVQGDQRLYVIVPAPFSRRTFDL